MDIVCVGVKHSVHIQLLAAYRILHMHVCVCVFVGSCLATKVFIGNLPATGRGCVIIK